jgi:hypothetical protein
LATLVALAWDTQELRQQARREGFGWGADDYWTGHPDLARHQVSSTLAVNADVGANFTLRFEAN